MGHNRRHTQESGAGQVWCPSCVFSEHFFSWLHGLDLLRCEIISCPRVSNYNAVAGIQSEGCRRFQWQKKAIKDILIWAICPRNQKDLQIMKDSYWQWADCVFPPILDFLLIQIRIYTHLQIQNTKHTKYRRKSRWRKPAPGLDLSSPS